MFVYKGLFQACNKFHCINPQFLADLAQFEDI